MTESLGDERLHAIWLATVEKLKEVVREFHITQSELHAAGDYFNRLGQSGMSRSLIDVALAMTSVDVTSPTLGGTRSNLEGPYHATHPERPDGKLIDQPLPDDAPILALQGVVTDAATGAPLPGVKMDFWQADFDGIYDRKGDHLRGVVYTGADGAYRIETVVPNDYAEHDHDPIGELFRAMGKTNTRAAHIHLKASIGGRVLLTTQIFMPTSTFLDKDYVEGAVSADLIADIAPTGEGARYAGRFDVRLTVPATSKVGRVRVGAAPEALKALMTRGLVAAPGACDAFTARLIARQGFEALYLGGNALGLSYAKGQPLITLSETVGQAGRIVLAADLPLIVDAGAGFGGPAHVSRAVLEIEAVGAAGLHIDDQPYPKSPDYHRGHGGLAPLEEATDRIRAAVRARKNPDFLIIARTDAYRATGSLDDALARGRAYAEAGADALMILDLPPARMGEVRAALPGLPQVWIGGVQGETPTLGALAAAPFDIAVYPMNTIAAIADAVSTLWAEVKATGALPQDAAFVKRWRAELSDIAGMPAYWALEDELAKAREGKTP